MFFYFFLFFVILILKCPFSDEKLVKKVGWGVSGSRFSQKDLDLKSPVPERLNFFPTLISCLPKEGATGGFGRVYLSVCVCVLPFGFRQLFALGW